ncbi:hypothetical protein [Paraburkholderia tropica]|uniref:hypothetical protein n=1 Tax=Paraburkholderia tropica TaxID=92647 RepID=UPI002AB17E94|nr:hypothetical protein [Paraburkholderia tropica]
MPVIKSYPRESLGRRPDALPEKPKDKQPLKITDGGGTIQAQIQMAREKGYTLDELIEHAAKEGIDANINSLRYAMRLTGEKKRVQRRNSTASGKQSRNPASPQKTNPPIDRHTGSMVIRDSYSFEITPDVEDL